jgi:hypothetical protein
VLNKFTGSKRKSPQLLAKSAPAATTQPASVLTAGRVAPVRRDHLDEMLSRYGGGGMLLAAAAIILHLCGDSRPSVMSV